MSYIIYTLAGIGTITIIIIVFLVVRWFWKTRNWKGSPWLGLPHGPG